jgi:predicted nuclease of predicted toxin-antitoxin system
MRLFLDAHISGRRVAQALRDNGYDVRAADEERALDGLDDESLFVLAADEGRILVTFNLKDFLPIMNAWAEAGRSHGGCILVASTLQHEQFGAIIAGIRRALEEVGEQGLWIDRVYWLSKGQTRQ